MKSFKIGETIPLEAQAHDGNPGLKVVAVLFDEGKNRIGTVELGHIENGLYTGTTKMPEVNSLTAQYITNEVENYAIASEVFMALPKPPNPEKIANGIIISKEPAKRISEGVAKRERD